MTFDVRLVAYAPDGDRLGLLPDALDVSASLPLNDLGSARVQYSALLRGAEYLSRPLEAGLEVALEVSSGGAWVEPAGGRFVRIETSTAVTDAQRVHTLTLPAYGYLLRKARLMSTTGLNEDGKRPFLSATAGVILLTLINEAKARGVLPGLDVDFTTAKDSAGAAWSKVITIYYAPGIDIFTVLSNLADQGVCDWQMQGRTLRIFNPDAALAVDRTTGSDPVTLHLGRDVVDAPQSESLADVVSTALIQGEEGLTLTESNPAAPKPWGGWDAYIQQGGVSDEGTARTLVQGELERGSRVRGQYTREITPRGARFLPVVDYSPGDYILAPGRDGGRERLRVRQITLTRDSHGSAGGNLVLNDRVLDASIRQARRTVGIVGGASAGGSGARPAPEGQDKRTPAAPLGLVVASNAYLDATGEPRGRIDATWAAVTTATDGTALEVSGYELAVRRNVAGAPWGVSVITETTDAQYSPLVVGESVQVRVRARGRYATTPGAWSSTVTLTVERDTTPPPVPSLPILSSELGTITARWDGKTYQGAAMPLDFDRVLVYREAAGSAPVGALREDDHLLTIPGLVTGDTHRVRFTAVDTSGNESSPTAWVPIVVTSKVADALADASAAAVAAQAAQTTATNALDKALANEGGISGALAAVSTLDDDLRPKITAAQAAANTAGTTANTAKTNALQALDRISTAEEEIVDVRDVAAAAVTSSIIQYALSTSRTVAPTSGWGTTTVTPTASQCAWMRTVVTYGGGSSSTSQPVPLTGPQGIQGVKGDAGAGVAIKGSKPSAAQLPTTGNALGDAWLVDGDMYVCSALPNTWQNVGHIRGPQGDPGDPGADGVGVASVTPFYLTTTGVTPAQPTALVPPAPWSQTEPAYTTGTVLWRTDRVVYTNAAFSYTPVSKSSAFTAAAQAYQRATEAKADALNALDQAMTALGDVDALESTLTPTITAAQTAANTAAADAAAAQRTANGANARMTAPAVAMPPVRAVTLVNGVPGFDWP